MLISLLATLMLYISSCKNLDASIPNTPIVQATKIWFEYMYIRIYILRHYNNLLPHCFALITDLYNRKKSYM